MTEGVDCRSFVDVTAPQIDVIRKSLGAQSLTLTSLTDILKILNGIVDIATENKVATFKTIAVQLERLITRHEQAKTIPARFELDTLRLAVDWLAQLLILYREELPLPKQLLAELLYTFKLIDGCYIASTQNDDLSTIDPFLDDPEPNLKNITCKPRPDLFADDPGFGLEFDLLHRTVSLVSEMTKLEDDPFGSDQIWDGEICPN